MLAEEGQLSETDAGYTFFWIGCMRQELDFLSNPTWSTS